MDFKHTSIKQSALGWVKKSIDDNLANIRSQLNIYIEQKDASILASVDTQLHDIQGVLTMIEQYGAAMLTEEMGSLCRYIASKDAVDESALEVLLRAVLQLPDYLEHIQAGKQDILIAILPLLNDIRAAKHEDLFSEKLLFLPDLSMHMDESESESIDDAQNQSSRMLAKKVRPVYQYSLLGLIRDKDVVNNLARLTKITEAMESRAASEQAARFWWIVGALIESIARDDLALGVSVKMLLGKVDQTLRLLLLKGERELLTAQPIELIKNLLYYIAQPECDGPKSQAIKTAYRLEQFLPADRDEEGAASIAGPNQELLRTVSDAIKADLEQVKSALEVYVSGDMAKTEQLRSIPNDLHVISDTLAMIGLGPQRQLIESQIKLISDIVDGQAVPEPDKLLAMAAELIQVDQALELMQKGQMPQALDNEETTSTASKNFEMENMLSAVVTAALDDIQKIKEAILDFIKDSTKEDNLDLCQTLLMETRGALALLNQGNAVSVVDGLVRYMEERDIVEFMDTRRLDQLSQVVVSIEYFLEALGEHREDADSILDFAEQQLQLLLEGKSKSAVQEDLESTHQNLLIDDGEPFEEVDEQALEDVNLDQMEDDLGDQMEAATDVGSADNAAVEQEETAAAVDPMLDGLTLELESISEIGQQEMSGEAVAEQEPQQPVSTAPAAEPEMPEAAPIPATDYARPQPDIEPSPPLDTETGPVSATLDAAAAADVSDLASDDEATPLEPESIELASLEPEAVTEDYIEAAADVPETSEAAEPAQEVVDVVVGDINDGLEQIQDALSDAGEVAQPQTMVPDAPADALAIAEEDNLNTMAEPAVAEESSLPDFAPVEETPVEPEPQAAPVFESAPPPLAQPAAESVPEAVPAELTAEAVPQAESQASAESAGGPQVVPVEEDLPILKPDTDEEILEIYLEEAEEESENIRQLQQDWKLHPEDENALKNIRRSFHTIKGSGRLVGAMKIGEFAWEYESLLNRVIDKTVMPSEQVIDAVGLAAEALPDLVNELKTQEPPNADIPYLRGLARLLSEFDASQVLEIRQIRQQEAAKSESTAASDTDEGSEEPEPAQAQTAAQPYDSQPAPTDQSADAIVEHPQPPAESPAAPVQALAEGVDVQTEETPPDPFVLSVASDMSHAEAEPPLPELVSEEATDLQIDPELLVIYQQEVESHLSTVNSVLNRSVEDQELVPTEDLYRALHTINGASRTADITSIGKLASLLEKPLKVIIEQGAALDADVLELYRQGHDAIHAMTSELVDSKRMPEIPEQLAADLDNLLGSLDHHTVELPEQDDQPSSQFVDTLTMMNETPEPDYDDELVEIFIEEATDLLEMSDHTLQAWSDQQQVDDEPEYGLVMELQRYLHTLKGGAKMADFVPISDLSHELESVFIAVIDNRVDKSDELIDALHDSFDLLQRQVDQAKNHAKLDSSDEQIETLHRIRTGVEEEQAATKDEPKAVMAETESDTQAVAETEESDGGEHAPAVERRSSDRDVVKVRSDLLDNLVNSAGEVSIYRARMEQQVSSFGTHLGELGQTISRLKKQLRDLEAETDAQIHFSHRQDVQDTQSFDPLELDRYTQIQELSKALGESVDDLSSLQGILGEQVKDSETLLLQQSRINTDLQDGLIRSRMVRFSGLTSRLRRLVRQTSGELAKKAELKLRGEHNEVDIKVLDRMVAPLEHIIRNAISHGIETPMERVKKGKNETGTILIDISRDGSDVVLRISDDGAGVNVDKVRRRALELGLLEEHEQLEDNDVVQFILEPGFSTADQVSQVAGRGVGMDVVDTGIKQLGGTLQISTSSDGTVFTARLPFTLSINQAILVRAGEETYALPLINIEGITRIEADQVADIYREDKPVLDYAGQQYGLHYLSLLIGLAKGYELVDPTVKVPVILLRSGDLRVALHIDEILGNREIVVKPLGKQLSQVKGLSGASILADGSVVLILDINGLIRHGVTTHVITHLQEIEPAVEQYKRKMVMVVDDSITMRRVATKLLTRNDYDVVTAKDGVDALAQLEDNHPDVMLLDIEMPRMDGFELASHMRNEPRFRDIPIIMITSRTGAKHRDHALEIGVNKYMGKPYQEAELVENIAQLVG